MICTANIGGSIKKVNYKNEKVMLFCVENIRSATKKEYFNLCCFDATMRDVINNNVNKVCQFKCIIQPNNYQDKKGNWVNTYSLIVSDIKIIGDKVEFQNVDESEIPF